MNSPVAVFEPIYSSNSFWFYTGLIGSLVLWAALIAILSQKKSKMEYQRRMLLALLFFIAAITTTGMGLFSGWAMMRTGKVSIFADALQVGSRRYPFEQVVKIYTQEDKQTSPINPNVIKNSTELLFVELKEGQLLVLSSADYETSRIFGTLKTTLEAYRKK